MNLAPDQLVGRTVIGSDGEKIGKINDVLLDIDTNLPEWASVKTGMFGSKEALVPISQAAVTGDDVTVSVTKAQVKDAPHVEPDQDLSPQEESELYSHYGIAYSTAQSDTGLPAGGTAQTAAPAAPAADGQTLTRSEEQLHVGKETVESGRVRLRKYVVTEQVTKTVPVTHEEVRVEREPITGAAGSGATISEGETEVVLHEERPVVSKETVPVEQVHLSTEQVAGEATVDEEVRKEQIDDTATTH